MNRTLAVWFAGLLGVGGALGLVLVLSACHLAASGNPSPALPATGPATDPASGVIAFYQGPLNHLSAVRSGTCPMHPSCSEYARQAITAYGPLKGWIMAMDRLLRCGRDETTLAPVIYVDGQPKFYDPLVFKR